MYFHVIEEGWVRRGGKGKRGCGEIFNCLSESHSLFLCYGTVTKNLEKRLMSTNLNTALLIFRVAAQENLSLYILLLINKQTIYHLSLIFIYKNKYKVLIRNRIISGELELVVIHNENSCIASYYSKLFMKTK